MHKVLLLMTFTILTATCGTSDPEQPSSAPSPDPPAQEQPTREAADARPIILAFGDSLTAGYGVPPGSGYPERLQRLLDSKGFHYRVVNAGISGDTTSGGLSRIHEGLQHKPSIVILELGANDGLRGLPVDQIRANLDEMITTFKNAGIVVLLAGMTLPRNYGADYIAAFEKIFPDLAAKHGVTLIPFFLEGAAGNPRLSLDDGIHPNEEGYRIITATVFKYLQPLLKPAS